MNALAEHNGPNLNTTRIYARSEPQQKKEGYSAPIQPCCYFISRKFASTIYTFCSFLVFMEFETRGWPDGGGGELPLFWTGLDFFVGSRLKRRRLCLCLTADLHGLGQPLPCQVRTQASDQGPTNRRHGRSAAGWDHPGRRWVKHACDSKICKKEATLVLWYEHSMATFCISSKNKTFFSLWSSIIWCNHVNFSMSHGQNTVVEVKALILDLLWRSWLNWKKPDACLLQKLLHHNQKQRKLLCQVLY